jgi:hypothetical protein
MFGNATKYFFGISLLMTIAATAYGVGTAVNGQGDVAFFGTVVLGTMAAAAAFMGWLALEAGDGASADRAKENAFVLVPAYWPIMASAGVGFLIVGLVINNLLAIFGLLVIITAAIEWTITAWADRRSGDVAANYAERQRLAMPLEVPLYGALAIAVPVYLTANLLLAISKNAAAWTALGLSTLILAIGFVFNAKPNLRRPVVASIVGLGAVGILAAGIISIANGTRTIEPHHGDDHGEEHSDEETEESLPSDAATLELVVVAQ